MHDTLLIVLVVLALAFDYINGFHDTANAIATSVSTRALSPRRAVWMSAVFNFVGALSFTGVAKTIGGDIVSSVKMVDSQTIIAALIAAIFWNLVTWYYGIPSSSSHAIIGGLIGAVLVAHGLDGLKLVGVLTIFVALVASPVIGGILGALLMHILRFLFGKMSPTKINKTFKPLQVIAAATMSFSHGANDAQKAMGIITLALLSAGHLPTLDVPLWVKLCCAAAMAFGTATGGWRIIKTMGGKIYKLTPLSGFAADLNSTVTIMGATLLHLPVSTTHVVAGSIMGVGSARRIKAVNWGIGQTMVRAWFLTIPLTAAIGGIIHKLIMVLFF
ncbi:MAG: inorganic phosphate transporter [Negativicutes bacterium]|jgi:PiT family inorganic phosphate transporter